LGSKQFEELQLMKFAWHGKIMDIASLNSNKVKMADLDEYCEMLEYDVQEYEFEKGEDKFFIDN